jgi:ubiquinol-cytochrome c reductase subunit 7
MRDDLLPSENVVVQEAIKRLSDKEAFDRTFRLRRAIQLHITHEDLPVSQRISPDQVHNFRLSPLKKFIGCSLSMAEDRTSLQGAG